MCGRFLLDADVEELLDRYRRRGFFRDNRVARSEIFPTNIVPIVTEDQNIIPMKWGFISPYIKRPIINARGETVDTKYMFKNALIGRRCIIPANAFFEWKNTGGVKIKYKIFLEDEDIFSMAGLYGDFSDAEGNTIRAFTIITTSPNTFMSQIHDRMPVILPRDKENIWLDTNIQDITAVKDLLKPLDEGRYRLKAIPV